MEKASLFEHNEQAYIKLCDALKHNKCATINHATGTGKSFIALKYLYEHNDKKYLYLAPTYPIIEQLLKSCYKIGLTPEEINIDTMIYRTLLKMDMEELYQKYDGIIFDEYHRTGAKETYKRIKELKLRLDQNNDGKKFIGLTATPIRYLDRERRMTDELFDGVEASKISLAEAMLDELLPIPQYINSKIACRGQYGTIKKRVGYLSPGIQKTELEDKLANIKSQIDNGSGDNVEMIKKYVTEKDGKYIVFCSTIEELEEYYIEVDEWFEHLGPVKKYKVYSNQKDTKSQDVNKKRRTTRQLNQDELDSFNDDKDGLSVLLCVDILNEGIHVDGIDGVILLRRTTSPIIYFQQIGRLLSYSGRNKQLKVFDLVNNFGNHNAIDAIYQEVKEVVSRRLENNPQDRKKYEDILAKFNIMDETREIIRTLDEIAVEVTHEKIVASRLNYSIDILSSNLQKQAALVDILGNEETSKAYTTISKYYKYVDNTQFERLMDLDIMLPEELSMSLDDRKELLGGYESVYLKERDEHRLCINEVIKFINTNGRMMSMTATNEDEITLMERYLECIPNLNAELTAQLLAAMDQKDVTYRSFEKAIFDIKVNDQDIDDLVIKSNKYLQDGESLPEYLQRAISNITINYNTKRNTELFKILDEAERNEQAKKIQREKQRYERISSIVNFLEQNIELTEQDMQESSIMGQIRELKHSDAVYIRKKYIGFKRRKYEKLLGSKSGTDLSVFCRRMKGLKDLDVDKYFEQIQQDNAMYADMKMVIDFMAQHSGKQPSKDSQDKLERKLAESLEHYTTIGSVNEDFGTLQQDMQSRWYSPEKIMYDIIFDRLKESNKKVVILKNVAFFNKYGRKPLVNSLDEDERALAIEYEESCISSMDNTQLGILNSVFNGKKNIRKTCQAYIENIIASQGEI